MLHVVIRQVGGYAREDAAVVSIVGAYEDPDTAGKVSLCSGGAQVLSVEVEHIPPGIRDAARELGIDLAA